MSLRWYSLFVLVFWAVTTGWLVKEKLLPPLLIGDPPSFSSILATSETSEESVAWIIRANETVVGKATTSHKRLETGAAEIASDMRLSEIRLADISPPWLAPLAKFMGADDDVPEFTLPMTARSTLIIDPLGRPSNLQVRFTLGDSAGMSESDALDLGLICRVLVEGVVVRDNLELEIKVPRKASERVFRTSVYLPPGALLGDAFSPQARLPDLRVGQAWKAPIYSPLRSPSEPVEILEARVDRVENIVWNEMQTPVFVVVYSSESSGRLAHSRAEIARAWVDGEGRVLRQEAFLATLKLSFDRVPSTPAP